MAKNTRVTISYDDVFCFSIRDKDQTIDMFGEDYLEDYGYDVPVELLDKYKAIEEEYDKLQKLIKAIKTDQDNERYNKRGY